MILSQEFQSCILSLLIRDPSFSSKWRRILTRNHFSEERGMVFVSIIDFFSKHSKPPTFPELKIEIKNKFQTPKLKKIRHSTLEVIRDLNDLKPDRENIERKIEDYLKITEVKNILPAVIEKIDLNPDEVYQILKETINKNYSGKDKSIDYFDIKEIKARIKKYSEPDLFKDYISTLVPTLDSLLRGNGVPPGKLCCVSAPYNTGKTTFMACLAKAAVMQNKNVLVIGLEEEMGDYASKFDASFSGVSINEIQNYPKIVQKKLIRAYKEYGKRLKITDYSGGEISISDIDMLLDEYEKNNFKVDLLIIDHLDLLRPTIKRTEKHIEITEIWQGAKSLTKRRGIVTWSPSHIGIAGLDKVLRGEMEVTTGSDFRGSQTKMEISDLHITLTPSFEDKEVEINDCDLYIKGFIDKSRLGPKFIIFEFVLQADTFSMKWQEESERKGSKFTQKNVHYGKKREREL